MLAERGRLLALAALDAETGEVIGGGTLHHLDSERKIVEIGYFVLPHARGRGIATTIARMLAEHAFSLGIARVAAYVNVGNVASERVADRAGFTREGVVRSMPVPTADASTRRFSLCFPASERRRDARRLPGSALRDRELGAVVHDRLGRSVHPDGVMMSYPAVDLSRVGCHWVRERNFPAADERQNALV